MNGVLGGDGLLTRDKEKNSYFNAKSPMKKVAPGNKIFDSKGIEHQKKFKLIEIVNMVVNEIENEINQAEARVKTSDQNLDSLRFYLTRYNIPILLLA